MDEAELKEQELFDRKMERLEREKKEREDQAAEIKRLEAERGEARALATRRGEIQVNQQAQLAEMRTALERIANTDRAITNGLSLVRIAEQALATDAGKAAADVLAAAVALGRAGLLDGRKEAKAFRDAVRAYRNEGRDDEA